MSQTTLTDNINGVQDPEANVPAKTLLVMCPGREFLVKYFRYIWGADWRIITRPPKAEDADGQVDAAVMISSTDIYAAEEGVDIDESAALKAETPYYGEETLFAEYCRRRDLPCVILRAANIVGTGMTGLPMRMARGVARGTLLHIKGNEETMLSVVHAMDIARLSKILQATPGTYNVTDGTPVTVDALIDAIAHRVKDKRVGTIKRRWARWFYGRRYFGTLTRTRTFSDALLRRTLSQTGDDAQMISVVQRLNTHQYGEDDV